MLDFHKCILNKSDKWVLCKDIGKPPRILPNVITCDSASKAMYVKISLAENNNNLYLDEVKIMGFYLKGEESINLSLDGNVKFY